MSCSTLLCFRLWRSAVGVAFASRDMNTAVPGTRGGEIGVTVPMNSENGSAPFLSRSERIARPFFQVESRV